MPLPLYAHSQDGQPASTWEPLETHLNCVAEKAFEFTAKFGAGEWGRAAGLLHDIGKLALDHCRHGLFVSLMQVAHVQHVRYHVIEAEVMPIGHAQIGASQAQRWNLPPTLCESIAYHHTPRAATLSPKLTAAVALANEIAHFLEDTPSGEAPVTLEDLLASCRESMLPLRIRPEALEGIVLTCRSEMEQSLSALAF